MKENLQKKITSAAFVVFLALFAAVTVILPDAEISRTERRPLEKRPRLTAAAVMDGSYMRSMEDYLKDQFAGREGFRSLKASFETKGLGKWDSGGYFRAGDSIYKLEPELKEKNIVRAGKNFQAIADQYFIDANIYYSIIPDRNYYAEEAEEYPSLDHERLETLMKEQMGEAGYLSLFGSLREEDYYRTDLHWRQERISGAADTLLKGMGAPFPQKTGTKSVQEKETSGNSVMAEKNSKYRVHTALASFLGGYAGASAFRVKPEELNYITNDVIDHALLYDYEKNAYVEIYAKERMTGTDPYDFFLWGARALLTLTNQKAEEGSKRLLLFRDSFGSSIAPLLLEGYREITLVDLRYVSADYALALLGETEYDDVLFLYSETLLNHSDSMKF